jgi:hypothetical protein
MISYNLWYSPALQHTPQSSVKTPRSQPTHHPRPNNRCFLRPPVPAAYCTIVSVCEHCLLRSSHPQTSLQHTTLHLLHQPLSPPLLRRPLEVVVVHCGVHVGLVGQPVNCLLHCLAGVALGQVLHDLWGGAGGGCGQGAVAEGLVGLVGLVGSALKKVERGGQVQRCNGNAAGMISGWLAGWLADTTVAAQHSVCGQAPCCDAKAAMPMP